MNNKKLIAACIALACMSAAQAQSNVTVYGLLDTAIRYTTNQNAAGDNLVELGEGALTGNRWGLRGNENLGNGLKAFFVLESGFALDIGTSSQGGRLFGRTAVVGLNGDFGTLQVGRQYTLAHEALSSFDAFGFANNNVVGFQKAGYTAGVFNDNMVKYAKTFGTVTVNAAYTFGEVASNSSANSTKAISTIYQNGPVRVGAVYQVANHVSSSYFGAVPASLASQQKVWGVGGSYVYANAKLYLGYTNSKLDVAQYQNDAVYAGISYPLGESLKLIATVHHDKLAHPNADGKRRTVALMLDYDLSKRTDVYVEIDQTKLKEGWVALASNSGLGTGSLAGNRERLGVMTGLRHRF